MGVFIELQTALVESLNSYQAERVAQGKTVSEKRLADIMQLREILAVNELEEENHAVLLRHRIESFIEKMSMHPLAHIIPAFFGSDLYQKIHGVLDQPNYRELILMAREHAEGCARQKKLLGYLENADICDLVKTIETLADNLNNSQKTCMNLEERCCGLQTENNDLRMTVGQLEMEITRLKQQQQQVVAPPLRQRYQRHGVENPREVKVEGQTAITYHRPGIFSQ